MELLDLYDRSTAWVASKFPAAMDHLDASTPCEDWTVRDLMNHLIQAQQLYAGAADGKPAAPPLGHPPELLGDDPARQYDEARLATLAAFRKPGVVDKAGPALGIAFADQLIHGWDLARATGQDDTMPEDLAATAFAMLDGRMPDDQRGQFFKPAVRTSGDAAPQERLLAYAGRSAAAT
jgi:uncharacterized protein (TIGR03086 family)